VQATRGFGRTGLVNRGGVPRSAFASRLDQNLPGLRPILIIHDVFSSPAKLRQSSETVRKESVRGDLSNLARFSLLNGFTVARLPVDFFGGKRPTLLQDEALDKT
jgi:hypothetical protein